VPAVADASGYVAIARTWRTGDVIDVRLPMAVRTEPLPNAPEYVAFAYGPIVLAGRLGTEGVTPDAQIIKNERESGNMLNATIDVPVLVGDASQLARRVRPVRGEPLGVENLGLGRPPDVRRAPVHPQAHERDPRDRKVQPA
jgi:DUF1680 family protein